MASIAIIAALGFAAVPFAVLPQANAEGQGTTGNFGLCNSGVIAYDLFYGLEDPGKGLADHRKAFCEGAKP